MSGRRDTGRSQWRPLAQAGAAPSPPRWRYFAGGGVVAVTLALGLVLGFGDLFGRPDATSAGQIVPVRMSMAGFEPSIVEAVAGEELTVELWTTDSAPHLSGGVHTLISDELGFYEELAADSRRTITLQMPEASGDYDIYCDTCCGGKQSPSMHGTLRVREA